MILNAKEIIRLMLSREGMKQKDISEILDITQPAVSQYISDKRGHGVKFNEEIQLLIREFAEDLYEKRATEKDIIPRTCQICKMVKTEDIMCQLHKEKDNIPLNCSACLSDKL